MTKIKIFKSVKEIDLPTFIDSRGLACANSGGGKSYLLRKICEETQDKVMIIILDVEGEFKTLREQFDFLLIGENADVSLNVKSAGLLPRKIMELEVSTIIDISDLKMHDRVMYVKNFLESLMELPREFWKPCIIIVDEAHLFCGQQEKQESTHAVIDLMTRGRKRGYCGILATQRIAKLHKDAVAETNNYMVGRIGLDIDMKRASEILGFTSKEQMLSLRDLEPGEFYVFGPAISKNVEKEIVGEVKTTHPKVGMDLRQKIVAPTDKIKSILQKISDLPKEQEIKLKEKKEFEEEIKRLKLELSRKPKEVLKEEKIIEVTDKVALEKAYERGAKETERKYDVILNSAKSNSLFIEKSLRKLLSDGAKIIESKSFSIVADKPLIVIPEFNSIRKEYSQKKVNEMKEVKNIIRNSEFSEDKKIGLCERKIYSLLAEYPDREFSKTQIGVFTGYAHSSGGFNNALAKLRSLNLIKGSGSSMQINELDSSIIGEFDFSMNNIISKLGKCEKEIFDFLKENSNEEFTKEEISNGTQTNYSHNSGGFNNSLSRLNTLGIIKRDNGKIKLNQELLEL